MKQTIKKVLRNFPSIMILLRRINYYRHRFLMKKRFRRVYLHPMVGINSVVEGNFSQNFFGYYNISPFNQKNEILFNEVKTEAIRGSLELPLKLRLKRDLEVIEVAEGLSWNWQQGCMLQWYQNKGESVIFNSFSRKKNRNISVIANIETGFVREIDYPIYSVATNGNFALTLNFDRLALMRPDYGYFNNEVNWKDLPNNEEDGIWFVNLHENTANLILSLSDLMKFKPEKTMEDAVHKVNHIDISPNDERFMFLHRWQNSERRFMRLLTANCSDGSDLFYVTGSEMVSHSCWWGGSDIISFCQGEFGNNGYFHFSDLNGLVREIGSGHFPYDGHPSISPDGKWMLTDEYPDKSRFSNLYIYNLCSGTKITIGSFFQPLRYVGEKRIDLHPRWNCDGTKISIDSGHSGVRKTFVLDVKKLVEDGE